MSNLAGVVGCSVGAAQILERETEELKRIVDAKYPTYDSDNPLDLGEACWLAQWFPEEEWSHVRPPSPPCPPSPVKKVQVSYTAWLPCTFAVCSCRQTKVQT